MSNPGSSIGNNNHRSVYIMLVFLIGFMGCGKSHIGRELAKLMKYKFIDTDELIEKKKKKTISELFATDGEEHFRQLENKIDCDS